MNTLPIYYENREVATIHFDARGFPELEYNEIWQRKGFDISVTLPRLYKKHSGAVVRTFF